MANYIRTLAEGFWISPGLLKNHSKRALIAEPFSQVLEAVVALLLPQGVLTGVHKRIARFPEDTNLTRGNGVANGEPVF